MTEHEWFERLAADTDSVAEEAASAALKSKVLSKLVTAMATPGPLLDLREVRRAGGRLCVFEHVVATLPEEARTRNPCRVCHARVLGERLTHAPIFWPGCPYSEFHNG
jgi:hypothetical protein